MQFKYGRPVYTGSQRQADYDELERLRGQAKRKRYVCQRCNKDIHGKGSNNAIYCADCWDYVTDGYRQNFPLVYLLRTEMPLITPKAFHRKLYKSRRQFREWLSGRVEESKRTGNWNWSHVSEEELEDEERERAA